MEHTEPANTPLVEALGGILDLNKFEKDYAAGKYKDISLHLHRKKKPAQTAKKETKFTLPETPPVAVVPYHTNVVCKCCSKISVFLTGWGLKYKAGTGIRIKTVDSGHSVLFDQLHSHGSIENAYVTELPVLKCSECLNQQET